MRAEVRAFRKLFVVVFFSMGIAFSNAALAQCTTPSSGILVTCDECEEPEEMVAAFESALPNAQNLEASNGELYLAIRFRTFGIWSTAFIPMNKVCGQSWEETVESNWSEIQQELADLLMAMGSGGGGGLGGGGSTGGGSGGSGGGPSGGVGTIDCFYTNGVGNDDNHWSCPHTDPNVGLTD